MYDICTMSSSVCIVACCVRGIKSQHHSSAGALYYLPTTVLYYLYYVPKCGMHCHILMWEGCYGLLSLCAVQRMLMSILLSSSGCRATPLQLSPHLLLNHGLVTTSTPPWSGSCLLVTRWWTPLWQAWSWMALHMYTKHRVRHRLCVGWSEGWLATWLRSKMLSWPRWCWA